MYLLTIRFQESLKVSTYYVYGMVNSIRLRLIYPLLVIAYNYPMNQ